MARTLHSAHRGRYRTALAASCISGLMFILECQAQGLPAGPPAQKSPVPTFPNRPTQDPRLTDPTPRQIPRGPGDDLKPDLGPLDPLTGLPRKDGKPIREVVQLPKPKPPIVVKRNSWGEHRGQSDIASSPVIQSLVKQSGGPSNGVVVPAWGTPAQIAACDRALRLLRREGRTADYLRPDKDSEVAAEQRFSEDCLGAVDVRVRHRVGRLHVGSGIVCTVFLISTQSALTARHCLFDDDAADQDWKPGSGAVRIRMAFPTFKSLAVELGPLGAAKRASIQQVLFPTPMGYSRHSLSEANGYKVPTQNITSLASLQRDFIVLSLAEKVTDQVMEPLPVSTPQFGDKLVVAAFHQSVGVNPSPRDTGIRQQVAGVCQVFIPNAGECIRHGCSMTQGGSGAPLIVERPVGTGTVLYLVGVHTGGSRAASHCPGDARLDTLLNFGVRLSQNDVNSIAQ